MFFQRFALLMVGLGMVLCGFSSALAVEVTISPMVGGYVFENNLGLKNSPVYSLGLGLNLDQYWSVEGTADYVETGRDGNATNLDLYSGRLGVLYHFKPVENLTPYALAGVGTLRLDRDDDGQFTYGLGVKLEVEDSVALRFEARHVVGMTIDKDYALEGSYNHFAFAGGLVFTFGELPTAAPDYESQTDKIIQEEQVMVAPVPEAAKPSEDSDDDGVIDVLDRCPVTPHGTPVDAEGCPESVKFIDSDGDGVSDLLDACPETSALSDVDVRGCPLVLEIDSDNDGIFDENDKCPGTELQIPVDATGCPVLSEKLKIAGLVIEYATSQTGFSEEAARELKLLAATIKSVEQGKLVVEGHTDSVGSEASNLKLSQQRAEKIRQALIHDFGVAADRVVARGYGPNEPVASNSTQAGRQQNRRVVVRYEP